MFIFFKLSLAKNISSHSSWCCFLLWWISQQGLIEERMWLWQSPALALRSSWCWHMYLQPLSRLSFYSFYILSSLAILIWKGIFLKSKNRMNIGSNSNCLSGHTPRKIESMVSNRYCTPMIIAAFSTIVKGWKQVSTYEWIEEQNVVCLHHWISITQP
jgi:hypothetical protein